MLATLSYQFLSVLYIIIINTDDTVIELRFFIYIELESYMQGLVLFETNDLGIGSKCMKM